MTRVLLLLTSVFALTLAACGDDSTGADMSACGPTTCMSTQYLDTKTCSCVNRDMSSSHD